MDNTKNWSIVVCINIPKMLTRHEIKIGSNYRVIESLTYDDLFVVDVGSNFYYLPKDCFMYLEEWREKQINNLLNEH